MTGLHAGRMYKTAETGLVQCALPHFCLQDLEFQYAPLPDVQIVMHNLYIRAGRCVAGRKVCKNILSVLLGQLKCVPHRKICNLRRLFDFWIRILAYVHLQLKLRYLDMPWACVQLHR